MKRENNTSQRYKITKQIIIIIIIIIISQKGARMGKDGED